MTASTAILLCVRNELPARIIRNLEPMLAGIDASGYAECFHLYILSDTNDADMARSEEARFSELAQRWHDRIAITYRRRRSTQATRPATSVIFANDGAAVTNSP